MRLIVSLLSQVDKYRQNDDDIDGRELGGHYELNSEMFKNVFNPSNFEDTFDNDGRNEAISYIKEAHKLEDVHHPKKIKVVSILTSIET